MESAIWLNKPQLTLFHFLHLSLSPVLMMLGAAQFSVADRSNAAFPIPNTRPALSSSSSSSSHTLDSVVFRLGFRAKRRHRGLKSIRITCDSSSRDRSTNQQDYEYIQASLLLSGPQFLTFNKSSNSEMYSLYFSYFDSTFRRFVSVKVSLIWWWSELGFDFWSCLVVFD